jgi:hypothetical protein
MEFMFGKETQGTAQQGKHNRTRIVCQGFLRSLLKVALSFSRWQIENRATDGD